MEKMKTTRTVYVLVIGFSLIAAAGCASSRVDLGEKSAAAVTPSGLDGYIEKLKSSDPGEQNSAAAALRQMGGKAAPLIPALIGLLDQGNGDEVAAILAGIGNPAVEPLLAALSSIFPEVRRRAVWTLGEIKNPIASRFVLPSLQDADPGVRIGAEEALAKLQCAEAVEPLISMLQKDENKWVRGSATRALSEIGDPRAVEPLIQALKNDSDSWVKGNAAKALALLNDPRAIGPLVEAMDDKFLFVQESSKLALGKFNAPAAAEPYLAGLKDADPAARKKAALVLGIMKPPAAAESLIPVLKDGDAGVRGTVAETLGKLKDPRALESLLAALPDENSEVRLNAVWALGEINDPRAIAPLGGVVDTDRDSRVRLWAVRSLGKIGNRAALEPVIRAVKDENPDVRGWAIRILKVETDKDFGEDFSRWRKWWEEENGK